MNATEEHIIEIAILILRDTLGTMPAAQADEEVRKAIDLLLLLKKDK